LWYLINFWKEKKNPDTSTRINLRNFPENNLIRRFVDLEKKLWQSPRHHHKFLPTIIPRGVSVSNNGGRPQIYIEEQVHIYVTALVLFCSPTKCRTLIFGRPCNRRHRTPYDYVEFHPVNDIHISHLCHHSLCLNRKHLIFETCRVNLRRNNCRVECCCNSEPKCFTETD